jgi:hypothetical protein
MNSLSLAELAIDAHGGLDRWRRFKSVSARLLNGGALWPLKHQQGILDDVHVRVDLRKEWASSLAVYRASSAHGFPTASSGY